MEFLLTGVRELSYVNLRCLNLQKLSDENRLVKII